MKQIVRLTESDLHRVIEESVNTILNEISFGTAKNAFKKAGEKMQAKHWDIDDREKKQLQNLHRHFSDRSRENFDPNMLVIIVGGDRSGKYTAQEIVDNFNVIGWKKPSQNPIYADSKLIGYPIIQGYIGPMWDGDKLRYETQEVYDALSI